MLNFKFESLRDAENMALLINGYCQLVNKTSESIWVRCPLSPSKKSSTSLENGNLNSSRNSGQDIKTPKKADMLTSLDDGILILQMSWPTFSSLVELVSSFSKSHSELRH